MIAQTSLRQNRVIQLPATIVTAGLMWLFPFLVHLIPYSGAIPIGTYLLPIFFAAFLSAWLFHPSVSLIASLVMPFANYVLTGMPTINMAIILSLELVVFSTVIASMRSRKSIRAYVAPVAVLIAKLSSMILIAIFSSLSTVPPWNFFIQSVANGLPGILLLLLLDLAIARAYHD